MVKRCRRRPNPSHVEEAVVVPVVDKPSNSSTNNRNQNDTKAAAKKTKTQNDDDSDYDDNEVETSSATICDYDDDEVETPSATIEQKPLVAVGAHRRPVLRRPSRKIQEGKYNENSNAATAAVRMSTTITNAAADGAYIQKKSTPGAVLAGVPVTGQTPRIIVKEPSESAEAMIVEASEEEEEQQQQQQQVVSLVAGGACQGSRQARSRRYPMVATGTNQSVKKNPSVPPNRAAAKREDKFSRYREKHREELAHSQRLRYRAKAQKKKLEKLFTPKAAVPAVIDGDNLLDCWDGLYDLRKKRESMGDAEYVAQLGLYTSSMTEILMIQVISREVDNQSIDTAFFHRELGNGHLVMSGHAVCYGHRQFAIRVKTDHSPPVKDHLLIKPSTINGAGLGLFAQRAFKAHDLIGVYCGAFTTNRPDDVSYTVRYGSGYVNGDGGGNHMGMHMINNYYCSKNKRRSKCTTNTPTNVMMTDDLLVWATKDIEFGEELFLEYKLQV